MKLLKTLLRYSRGGLLLANLAGCLSGLASAAVIAMVNTMLRPGAAGSARQLAIYAALALATPLTGILSTHLLMRIGQQAIVDIRLDLCRRILGAPLRHLEQLGSSGLLATLTEDVSALTQAVTIMPLVATNGALLLGCLVYLGHLSWRMLLILLIMMLVGSASYYLPTVLAARQLRAYREVQDGLYDLFRGLAGGLKELKLHAERRHGFLDRIAGSSRRLRDRGVAAMTLFSTADSSGRFVLLVVLGGLLFGAPHLPAGDRRELAAFVVALLFIMAPLKGVLGAMPQVGRANVALQKIEQLGFDLRRAAEEEEWRAAPPTTSWQRLELRGVTHGYHGDSRFTLGPIDLEIMPGELLFITGGNGSGKTTLAKLIVGLYSPDAGEILLDGQPVIAGQLERYRQHFSAIFSDFYLFDELDGIEREGLEARVTHYLERLDLHRKVSFEVDGKLPVRELSQGQRKRLALLTAYLEDRPIYLFDEWAADQDPFFKEVFYHQLLPELKQRGKAVCVISHDEGFYGVADRVIKLVEGRVACGPAGTQPQGLHGSAQARPLMPVTP